MPLDWVNFVDERLAKGTSDYTLFDRYIAMYYYAVLNIGSNEFGPVSPYEMLFTTLSLLLSTVFNNLIISDIISLLGILDSKD